MLEFSIKAVRMIINFFITSFLMFSIQNFACLIKYLYSLENTRLYCILSTDSTKLNQYFLYFQIKYKNNFYFSSFNDSHGVNSYIRVQIF